MDQRFLNYYRRELLFMREIAADFALKHPKIAKRLNIHGTTIADPWVERLIDSFCFLTARTQLKIDAEFEPFTQRLLNSLSPEYTMPTPAKSVVAIVPSALQGELTAGYTLPTNTSLMSRAVDKSSTRCEFRTCRPLTLWPITLQQAVLTQISPEEMAAIGQADTLLTAKAAIRLTLSLSHELCFSQLKNCDELPIYLKGDEQVSSHLFELIACHYSGIVVKSPSYSAHFSKQLTGPLVDAHPKNYAATSSLWQGHHGYRCLKDFFDCRSQFYFFTIKPLVTALHHCHDSQLDILLLLDCFPAELVSVINAERFSLHCVPVINLFPGKVDRVNVRSNTLKHPIIVDRTRPADYEVCLVSSVSGFSSEGELLAKFSPLYQGPVTSENNEGRYFSVERTPHLIGDITERHSTECGVWLSLVDQSQPPHSPRLASLHIDALVSNRHLPSKLPQPNDEGYDLQLEESIPAKGAIFVSAISRRYDSLAYSDSAWKLINLLQCTYQPLDTDQPIENATQLRERLKLFLRQGDNFSDGIIRSVVSLTCQPIVKRLAQDDLLLNSRGVKCQLTVDESLFSSHSPFLFGHVIALFLSTHSTINSFVEMELLSLQRGTLHCWPAIIGQRGRL
ncbi:type VI secretion system baseplate subunit TssF [Tatumella ptyseos]|uniref:type VI secretion system baseplate subunit TssF n=1 Tax=Tatumella ptyseos TaxID=82987 RepID=UPI0026EC8C73|nr:type VI secretion system baseplate subunit TssF [Tatumella ptyseos]WKX27305.1 type VI secretion system baseplate subunit TssF [Tatumella ptyseos]